jgi:hypothetical protein
MKKAITMKKSVKLAAMVALGLLVSGSVYAQVQETKTYKDGSTYTGQFNGKGKKEFWHKRGTNYL